MLNARVVRQAPTPTIAACIACPCSLSVLHHKPARAYAPASLKIKLFQNLMLQPVFIFK